jgi:hypothetical protein
MSRNTYAPPQRHIIDMPETCNIHIAQFRVIQRGENKAYRKELILGGVCCGVPIEYPSDYHFQIRFMLALCAEVLEYIIKTHSVSAEQSTLVQIWSACKDYERSHEYGKQLAAVQTRLGGSKPSNAQHTLRAIANVRSPPRPQRPPQRAPMSSHNTISTNTNARPHGEGQSKTVPVTTPFRRTISETSGMVPNDST